MSELKPDLQNLIEVERLIFSERDDQVKSEHILRKSRLYSDFKQYEKALQTLSRINPFGLEENLHFEVINERIVLNYLLGEHRQVKNAILEASLIEGYMPNKDMLLVEILNYVALEDFDKAESRYEELKSGNNASEVFETKRLKKVERAYNLSLALPGSGQIYAGYVFKGLTSLSVQGILFAYGVQGIQQRYFFTQALPSIGIFQGFYFGGAEYARELTVKRNAEIVQSLSRNIVNSLK